MMDNFNWANDMMGGYSFFCVILWVIILIDLVLLGMWLWKQIQKK